MQFSSPVRELGSGSSPERVYSKIAESSASGQRSALKSGRLTPKPANCHSFLSQLLSRPKLTGAALAVTVGDHLECIWSHGSSAPPCGSRCYPGVGLTGLGFSAGKLQLCNDTRTDSRVDREACLNLDVKSVLVIPLKSGSAIAGVLEVLSSAPNVFDWRAVRLITRMAKELDVSALTADPSSLKTGSPQEKVAAISKRRMTRDFDLQEVLHAAWVLQHYGALGDIENAEFAKDETDRSDRYSSKTPKLANAYVGHTPSSNDAHGFESLNDDFTNGGGYGKYMAVAVVLAIPLVCFFLFRMQVVPLGTVFHPIPQAPQESSRSSPAALPADSPAAQKLESRNNLLMQESTRRQKLTHEAVQKPMPQSYAGAMMQFEDEARNGDADASWKLGLGYLRGIGVPKDEVKAAEWLKKAANLDDARAQTTLSDCYLRGVGVRRDYVRAYTWASIAARQSGGQDQRLASLRQEMTQTELDDANRRVDAWFVRKSFMH
jgi:Sel1 repeat/GAF domain